MLTQTLFKLISSLMTPASCCGKSKNRLKSSAWMLFLVSLLTACGDSNIEYSTNGFPGFHMPPSKLPIDVVSVGPISALPNTMVNGITYNTTAANVTVNGKTGTLADLQIGHMVTVDGRLGMGRATGFADSIEFEANVIGPIESIDTTLRRIVVMGQTVVFDSDTTFDTGIDSQSLTGLSPGAVVQISGFAAGGGEMIATRVEHAQFDNDYQVIGSVAGLDIGNLAFQISALVVDYGSAGIIELPGGMPADAMNVIVRGSLASDGRFIAEQMTGIALDRNIEAGTQMEIAGYISSYQSDTDFEVSGIPVTTDFHTIFHFGMRGNLRLGAKVEIEGKRSAGGTIIADRIGFGSLETTFYFSSDVKVNATTDFTSKVMRQDF